MKQKENKTGVQAGVKAAIANGLTTTGEIAEKLKVPVKSLRNSLFLLKRKGEIIATGKRGSYVYSISSGERITNKEQQDHLSDTEFRTAFRMIMIEVERRLLQHEALKRKLKTLGGGE